MSIINKVISMAIAFLTAILSFLGLEFNPINPPVYTQFKLYSENLNWNKELSPEENGKIYVTGSKGYLIVGFTEKSETVIYKLPDTKEVEIIEFTYNDQNFVILGEKIVSTSTVDDITYVWNHLMKVFITYSNDTTEISAEQFKEYIEAITKLTMEEMNISVVPSNDNKHIKFTIRNNKELYIKGFADDRGIFIDPAEIYPVAWSIVYNRLESKTITPQL